MGWIIGVGLVGAVMGLATSFGLPDSAEGPVWLAVFAVGACLLAARGGRRFLTGLAAGCVMGALAPLVQAALFDVYVSNHPQFLKEFEHGAVTIDPRLFLLLLALPSALGSGLVLGALTVAAGRLLKRPTRSDDRARAVSAAAPAPEAS